MPVEGFKSITVKTEYYEKLKKIAEKLELKISKTVEKLIDDHEMFE